mmetsp:Transcript_27566/g.72866  ORF Transcript_27566/g.72866 Transcript_27566/m.72866 type:complete len:126 (+) Transcript_27566:72-449(+)
MFVSAGRKEGEGVASSSLRRQAPQMQKHLQITREARMPNKVEGKQTAKLEKIAPPGKDVQKTRRRGKWKGLKSLRSIDTCVHFMSEERVPTIQRLDTQISFFLCRHHLPVRSDETGRAYSLMADA